MHAQLLRVHALLGKVSAMGPLVSLLKANIVREEFLRTNRDLLDTFGILARGEQLLVSHLVHWSMQSTVVAPKDHPLDGKGPPCYQCITMKPAVLCCASPIAEVPLR
jgi:hypothetical protein